MNGVSRAEAPPAWESEHWWSTPSDSTPIGDGSRHPAAGQLVWPHRHDTTAQADRAVGGLIVVVGAVGGCGATTLAGVIARAVAARSGQSFLVDLDLAEGDIHRHRALPLARTIADLHPVIDEITPEHLEIVAHPHPSGVALMLSPGDPDVADRWSDGDVQRLLVCARASRPTIVDLGRAPAIHRMAACEVADRVVVVCPPILRAMSRVATLVTRHERERVDIVVIDRPPRELSPRQIARMVDHRVALVLRAGRPRSDLGAVSQTSRRSEALVAEYVASLEGWGG